MVSKKFMLTANVALGIVFLFLLVAPGQSGAGGMVERWCIEDDEIPVARWADGSARSMIYRHKCIEIPEGSTIMRVEMYPVTTQEFRKMFTPKDAN